MDVLDANWLFSEPIDYEHKKYKFLSALKKYSVLIKADELYDVLLEIENRLEDLYKYKYEKNILDDRMKVLKGIDVDNMSLLYEYPENSEHLQIIENLSDESVELLEKLYRFLRDKWRINASAISLTTIPTKKIIWSDAILYVITYDKKVLTYHFNRPSKIEEDWKNLNFNFDNLNEKYDLRVLSENVSLVSVLNPGTQCIRADVKREMPLENCLLPILKYVVFNAIRKGDI